MVYIHHVITNIVDMFFKLLRCMMLFVIFHIFGALVNISKYWVVLFCKSVLSFELLTDDRKKGSAVRFVSLWK